MVGILIVSHGPLAGALISSVRIIAGTLKKVKGVSIWPKDKREEIQNRIQKHMAEVNDGDGVIILTDMLGGTPTNISLPFLRGDRVVVVTGVNLPMLLAIASYRKERSLEQISLMVKRAGRRSIILVQNFLKLPTEKSK